MVGRNSNMWRYRELLPVLQEENIVSLGEGWTPIFPARRLAGELQLEKLFGRNPEAYLIQLMNDGLIDIANRKQGYTVSATTDLEKKKRWYTLPPTVLSVEKVEILDTNDRYIMIPKLSDPHKLLRADSDSSNEALK